MGVIEEIYEDLDADLSLEDYRSAVEERVAEMGGLADEETAAMLVAHELDDAGGEIDGIADIEAGMQEVKFVGKVTSVGDLRTFDREEDEDAGHVLNVDVADETGQVRIALWDGHARDAADSLEVGDVLRIKGRPQEGYSGVEVNVTTIEPDPETDVDVTIDNTYDIAELTIGLSEVTVAGQVLDTEAVRTFERDDGSEGKVANALLGDATGRTRVTLWDSMADHVTELTPGDVIEIIDGYVRERDGELEVHIGDRGTIEPATEPIEHVPDTTAIEDIEMGQTVDLKGVVRSADPKRTFDRDDGSEGQVRNLRIQDNTGDIRVALWGAHADREIGPGDAIAVIDAQIEDGWQDDLEASANWQSAIVPLEESIVESNAEDTEETTDDEPGVVLSSFEDGTTPTDTSTPSETAATEMTTEVTGVVIQPGEPVKLDVGDRIITVETSRDVGLGEEVTVKGRQLEGDRIDAEELHR